MWYIQPISVLVLVYGSFSTAVIAYGTFSQPALYFVHMGQPIAFGVSFLHSQFSIDDLLL